MSDPVVATDSSPADANSADGTGARVAPSSPSIAVLPFQNMSGDPEQEYFADGMVEEIITALSRIRWLLRYRPEFDLHLQGPSRRCEAGWPRAWRSLCARGRCAQIEQPHPHHRAIGRSRRLAITSGRSATTATSPTSLRCRTKSPSVWSRRSSRSCMRPSRFAARQQAARQPRRLGMRDPRAVLHRPGYPRRKYTRPKPYAAAQSLSRPTTEEPTAYWLGH